MTPFEEQVLQLQVQGYAIVPGALSSAEADEGRRELERVLAEESDPLETPLGPSEGWAYDLMNKARVFERLYQIPDLLRLIRHFLGDDCVLSAVQGRVVHPGAPVQGMHYDGAYTGPFRAGAPADGELRAVSQVFGMNVIFCLTDFTREDGATRVVPGSHRLPGREIPDNHPPGEVVVEAPRGSALVFNIATWHGQSAHYGTEPRYAVMTPWRRSWVRPEADLSRRVLPEVLERAGAEGRTILGFAARAPYVERWQWDADQGRPRDAWRHLERDEPGG